MLKINLEQNGVTTVHRFMVVDAHSHLGQDEDGSSMTNPNAPGQGTFDFWGTIENKMRRDWQDNKTPQSYSTLIGGVQTKVSLSFEQMPMIRSMLQYLETNDTGGRYKGYWNRVQYQNLIDQGVVFPFQDVFRNKMPEAQFRASNLNVSRHVSRFPTSLRLKGYMRCVPWEGQKAVDEVEYWAAQSGQNIRGLKLHPRSDGWLDTIASPQVINVIKKAVEHNFPIIFDTRGKQTILDLGELINTVRVQLKKEYPERLSQFKAIIAHAAAGNVDDEEVYYTIAQPNTYMDLSLCQGKTVERFLKSFRIWCRQNQVKEKTGRSWSEYCLYATDYPFFQEVHASALLSYVIGPAFFENGGTIQDMQNILGLNQLRLFPEYNQSIYFSTPTTAISSMIQAKIHTNPIPEVNASQEILFHSIAKMVGDGVYDINQIYLQVPQSGDVSTNNAVFLTSRPKCPNETIPLLALTVDPAKFSILATLPPDSNWKPNGYNYFDSDTRQMFRECFETTRPAQNPNEVAAVISKAYNH
ncbi:MAG: amidohydrolase family protein [Promethearchaeota archaeon]